jgi:hypothetical protein
MVHAARASTASAPAPLSARHFLIASFSAISAPAPHLTHHSSPITHHCLTPFLFGTNKAHKIIILMSALLKTKEKQYSIPYKFAPREIRNVFLLAWVQNVRNFRCYSNAACLAVLVVLTCPAAWGQIGSRGWEWGHDGDETVEFDGTAGGI